MRRKLPLIVVLAVLASCKTDDSDDWTGGATTPYRQAELSCSELLESISEESDRRAFFIGCMGALGWAPKPGATIEL